MGKLQRYGWYEAKGNVYLTTNPLISGYGL